jgi:hypothetical protein
MWRDIILPVSEFHSFRTGNAAVEIRWFSDQWCPGLNLSRDISRGSPLGFFICPRQVPWENPRNRPRAWVRTAHRVKRRTFGDSASSAKSARMTTVDVS